MSSRRQSSDKSPQQPDDPWFASATVGNEDILKEAPKDHTAPPDCLQFERLNDMIDFELEHILLDGVKTRWEHYRCLEYFWKMHPAKTIKQGRRYILFFLAELLCAVCGKHPYPRGSDGGSESANDTSGPVDALYALHPSKWASLEKDLDKIRALLLRKDATTNYSSIDDAFPEAAVVEIGHAQSRIFGAEFDSLKRKVTANRLVSPMRKKLEEAMDTNTDLRRFVKQDKIDEIMKALSAIDDKKVKKNVNLLFESSAEDQDFQPVFALVSEKQVKSIMKKTPFDLCLLQKEFEKFVLQAYTQVFVEDASVLAQIGYSIPSGSQIARSLRKDRNDRPQYAAKAYEKLADSVGELRQKRSDLNNEHGEDPIHESLEVSEPFGLPKKKPLRGRSIRVDGSNGEGSDDDSPEKTNKKRDAPAVIMHPLDREYDDSASRVSSMMSPSRKRPRRPIKVEEGDPKPDPGIFDENGRVMRRLMWSDEEKDCIREGTRRHGIGRWAEIKKDFKHELRNRSTVQIKDCWRTMTQSGQVVPTDFPRAETRKSRSDNSDDLESTPGSRMSSAGKRSKKRKSGRSSISTSKRTPTRREEEAEDSRESTSRQHSSPSRKEQEGDHERVLHTESV